MKVTVCIGSSCHLKGSRQVVEALQHKIAEHGLGDRVELGGTFCMGQCQKGVCVTVDDDFYSVSPETVDAFLDLYGDSVTFMSDENNPSDAPALVAELGITANEQIAAKAIPQCNLTLLTGNEMKETLQAYYQVLFQADPASIGGETPYDDFYYGAE